MHSNAKYQSPEGSYKPMWEQAMIDQCLKGWLKKESHEYIKLMRKWQWRYFVLDFPSKSLAYFTDEDMKDQRGVYELDGKTLSEVIISKGALNE